MTKQQETFVRCANLVAGNIRHFVETGEDRSRLGFDENDYVEEAYFWLCPAREAGWDKDSASSEAFRNLVEALNELDDKFAEM